MKTHIHSVGKRKKEKPTFTGVSSAELKLHDEIHTKKAELTAWPMSTGDATLQVNAYHNGQGSFYIL